MFGAVYFGRPYPGFSPGGNGAVVVTVPTPGRRTAYVVVDARLAMLLSRPRIAYVMAAGRTAIVRTQPRTAYVPASTREGDPL